MENSPKILVVDDEKSIVEIISYNLKQNGYTVFEANNGVDALKLAKLYKPDLILLDIMMPYKDGYDTCRDIKNDSSLNKSLVFFLTALTNEESEIKGFEVGGDDFISKPIKPKALLSRINAALAKTDRNAEILKFDGLEINRQNFSVVFENANVIFARKEFELLSLLASKPGKVFERDEILNKIWGSEIIVGDRTIDVHIRKIRQKLNEKYIFTVKGVGYKFES